MWGRCGPFGPIPLPKVLPVPQSTSGLMQSLQSPIVRLRATQSRSPPSLEHILQLIPVPLNPAFSFPPVHPSSLKPSLSVATSLPSQSHSVPQSIPAASPIPPGQPCPRTGEPCPCPPERGSAAFQWRHPPGPALRGPRAAARRIWCLPTTLWSPGSPRSWPAPGTGRHCCCPPQRQTHQMAWRSSPVCLLGEERWTSGICPAAPPAAAAMAARLLLPATCVGTTVCASAGGRDGGSGRQHEESSDHTALSAPCLGPEGCFCFPCMTIFLRSGCRPRAWCLRCSNASSHLKLRTRLQYDKERSPQAMATWLNERSW